MRNTSDSVGMLNLRETSLTPLAVLGAVALTAGLTAYRAWPVRRHAVASARKRYALPAYLRDHLSGSDVALRVVRRLAATQQGREGEALFRRLSREFEEESAVVRTLLARLGASEHSIKRAAGFASGSVLSVTSGGEPGDLSLFRTLEALAIGVQGKRLMWRALQSLRGIPSTVNGITFAELEAQALRQWEDIETNRRALVEETFSAASSGK